MTISWFQSGKDSANDMNNNTTIDGPRYSIQEVVKALYPAKHADGAAGGDRGRRSSLTAAASGGDRSRFSQLLLEHGEKHLQDWAVVAYSSPSTQDLSRAIRQQTSSLSSTGNTSANTNNVESPGRSLNSALETQWAQSPSRSSSNNNNKRSRHNNTGGSGASLSHKKQQQLLLKQYDKERYPSTQMTKIEGRLHLCSRSLVFEPTDHSRGIVRCPFARMDHAPQEYPYQEPQYEAMCIAFTSHKHFVMKENNNIGPFTSVALPVQFRFTFLHSSPRPFVELCQQLFTLASSNHHSSNNTTKKATPSSLYATPELEHLLQPMLERPFDLTQLVDVRERPLTTISLQACLLTPLQRLPGCVVVTSERLYFQPASGALTPSDTKATHWVLRQVVAAACRYSGLRDCALELYFPNATVLLAFERRRDREQVLRCLPRNTTLVTDREFVVQAVQAWQQGQLDNYEYLLALNAAAGRSFQDLSRYPVFPWVLAQYDTTTAGAKKNNTTLDLNDPKNYRDLSKPVGALNAERLQYFKTRLEGMQDMDETFLYGTHYSTPGYVLYYLVRSMPEQMLCLQNGKFDAPDRMFHSMSHCFNCVLTNNADVKELIPEFFNYKDFDFLINARGLQLGATQTGERVDDVVLPSWAKSPRDFLKKNRKALESDICTKMLPQWIDLIFGCKSRGDAAMEADNLFHSCCYLGANDLAAMKTEEERFQAELQATEFGLVPDLLFAVTHPQKGEAPSLAEGAGDFYETLIAADFGAARSLASSSRDYDSSGPGKEAWELLDPPSINSSHGEQASNLLYSQPTTSSGQESPATAEGTSFSPSRSGAGAVLSVNMNAGPTAEVGISVGGDGGNNRHRMLPLSGSGDLDRGSSSGRGAFSTLGSSNQLPDIGNNTSYDSNNSVSPRHRHPASSLATPSAEWDMVIMERREIHGDAVSGCALVFDGSEQGRQPILATTSLDGGLMVHTVSLATHHDDEQQRRGFSGTLSRFSYIAMSRGQITPAADQSKLQEYRSHASRDPLACLVLASDGANGQVAFAGGHDDVVLAYGINSACAVASVYSHRDAVTGLDLIPRSAPMPDSALWLERSTHIMVSGSWDATVKVWSVTVAKGETVAVNREPLAELFDADSSIVCVSAISVQHQQPNGGIVIGAGCADGSFCVWNLHNDGVTTVIHNEPARRGSGPCSVLKWSITGGRTHLFTGFSTGKVASFTLDGGMLRKESAVSFGVAVTCLVYSEGILLVGCADGGLRLIPVRDGAVFDSKPSLWAAVNNKNAPGISSLSITYAHTKDGAKCLCCTGGEDGSVALFELKRVLSSNFGT